MKRTMKRAFSLALTLALCLTLLPTAFAAGAAIPQNTGYDIRKDDALFYGEDGIVWVRYSGGTAKLNAGSVNFDRAVQQQSADGTRAAAYADGCLFYFDGKKIVPVSGDATDTFHISWDGSAVCYLDSTGALHLYSGGTNTVVTDRKNVGSISIAPDGKSVGYVDENGDGCVWNGRETLVGSSVREVVPSSGCKLVYTLYQSDALTVRAKPAGSETLLTECLDGWELVYLNRDGSMALFADEEGAYVSANGGAPAKITTARPRGLEEGEEGYAEYWGECPILPPNAARMRAGDVFILHGMSSFAGCIYQYDTDLGSCYLRPDLTAEVINGAGPAFSSSLQISANGGEALLRLDVVNEKTGEVKSALSAMNLRKGAVNYKSAGEADAFVCNAGLDRIAFAYGEEDGSVSLNYRNRKSGKGRTLVEDFDGFDDYGNVGFFYGDWFYYMDGDTMYRTVGGAPERVNAEGYSSVTISGKVIRLENRSDGSVLYSTDGKTFTEIEDVFPFAEM